MGIEPADEREKPSATTQYVTDNGIVYDVEADIRSMKQPSEPATDIPEHDQTLYWLSVTVSYNAAETAESYSSLDEVLQTDARVEQEEYEEPIPVLGTPYLPGEEELEQYAEHILGR